MSSLEIRALQSEYVWFAGQPVGQKEYGFKDTLSWTFTDHLGTPFIQTDPAASISWRAEYEPYGRIFALRTPNHHQSLRLPGQEVQETNTLSTDGNGASEQFYNVFRWYRFRWGRYSQGDPLWKLDYVRSTVEDPIGFWGGINLYAYVDNRPTFSIDPTGLSAYLRCDIIDPDGFAGANKFGLKGARALRGPSRHCYIEVECTGRYRVTLELKGPTGRFPNGFTLMRSTALNNRRSDTTSAINPCGCPTINCQFEDELLNQFGTATSNRGDYIPAWRNSNTFAATIITGAGGAAAFPPGATGGSDSACRK